MQRPRHDSDPESGATAHSQPDTPDPNQPRPAGTPTIVPTWSHTRDATFRECQRKYFFRYVLALGGWLHDAEPRQRTAWALGKLQTLASAIGMAVHRRARELALAVKAGRPLPSYEELYARSAAEMNRLYLVRDRREFLRTPSTGMLLEWFYKPNGPNRAEVGAAKLKLQTCLQNLATHELWDELRGWSPDQIVAVDGLATYEFRDGTTIHAAPDLVLLPGDDSMPIILDWKTSDRGGLAEGLEQVAAYCALARDGLGIDPCSGHYRACVVNLASGDDEWVTIDPADLTDVERRIERSLAAMRWTEYDRETDEWASEREFRVSESHRRCAYCPFREICDGAERLAQDERPLLARPPVTRGD